MEFTLKRVLFTDDGVLGVLIKGSKEVCRTLEREWKDNARGLSCIPEGSYLCQRVDTPKHGNTFEVTSVPHRTAILIHSGNTEADSEGCILVGMEVGELKEKDATTGAIEPQMAVLRSKEAFEKFMDLTEGKNSFALHVKNC